ncbi:MAG: DNA methyltransferase [Bacteroidota bacterium]|nr:DNA methyltransferase [Bacteroidota bacterium]
MKTHKPKNTKKIKEPQVGYQSVITDTISGDIYFKSDNITIIHQDILKLEYPEEFQPDLIITSPPYNVDIQYNSHKDDMNYDSYLKFTEKWLEKCFDISRDTTRFCLNIPLDKNKGGQQSVCADITSIAKRVGWKYHSTIIWNEQNISRRTAWGSWLSASAPYVIAPVEVILILYKVDWKRNAKDKQSDIIKKEFMDWTNGVWNFSGESKKRIGHPAPFPIELPIRCIKLFSFVGDIVLDPFLGSGTTLVACAKLNRIGVGIEVDKGYCELAKKRIIKEGQIYQLVL